VQRNPYWPLNGPSFFAMLKFRRGVFSRCTKVGFGFGSNLAARMASRRPNIPEKQDFKLATPFARSNTFERWFGINCGILLCR
jgi:hypothetical protein